MIHFNPHRNFVNRSWELRVTTTSPSYWWETRLTLPTVGRCRRWRQRIEQNNGRFLTLKHQLKPGKMWTKCFMILWGKSGAGRCQMITKEKRARINPRRRDVRSSKLILCKNVLRANYNILKFQASDVSDSNQNHF